MNDDELGYAGFWPRVGASLMTLFSTALFAN